MCVQAELYSLFKSIGEAGSTFHSFLEVKRQPGVDQRIDILLSMDQCMKSSSANFAGFELKMHKLRKKEIVEAVEEQAAKYKNYHNIRDMFVVNFVSKAAEMDIDMPGKIGEVVCVYVRFGDKFSDIVVHAPALKDADIPLG